MLFFDSTLSYMAGCGEVKWQLEACVHSKLGAHALAVSRQATFCVCRRHHTKDRKLVIECRESGAGPIVLKDIFKCGESKLCPTNIHYLIRHRLLVVAHLQGDENFVPKYADCVMFMSSYV